jgi:hypothetical protein
MSLSDDIQNSFLKSIELSGSVDEASHQIKIRLNENLSAILDKSSGRIRLKSSLAGKFSLILAQPAELKPLSNLEIRCLYCRKVISYPAWHLVRAFDINHFHYFICWNTESSDKPSLNCKRG